jgi:hypothetical protein
MFTDTYVHNHSCDIYETPESAILSAPVYFLQDGWQGHDDCISDIQQFKRQSAGDFAKARLLKRRNDGRTTKVDLH